MAGSVTKTCSGLGRARRQGAVGGRDQVKDVTRTFVETVDPNANLMTDEHKKFHKIGKQYASHRYLAEFDFRYNNRIKLGVNDYERADNILAGVTNGQAIDV